MSDENKHNDEEYHYPEEEYVVDAEQEQQQIHEEIQTKTSKPAWAQFLLRNKRVVMLVVLVVFALLIFQIMSYKKNNKVIMKQHSAASQQTQLVHPEPTTQNLKLQESLSKMQQQATQKDSQISNLKEQLDQLQEQMNQTTATNKQLKQAMVLLLKELKNLDAQLHEKQKTEKYTGPKLTYNVRAIVQGRAWVVGSNGLSESVTVGDPIPGYGTVQSIVPDRGLVTTSTGKDITYGKNDF